MDEGVGGSGGGGGGGVAEADASGKDVAGTEGDVALDGQGFALHVVSSEKTPKDHLWEEGWKELVVLFANQYFIL